MNWGFKVEFFTNQSVGYQNTQAHVCNKVIGLITEGGIVTFHTGKNDMTP